MKTKTRIALYWLSSCGGCEESVIDLSETLLEVTASVEIVFWPVALDYKYEALHSLPDADLDAAFINGAVRMDEQEEMARLLRKKSKLIFAHGSCAHLGGVVGLANLYTTREALSDAYLQVPTVTNPDSILPQTRTYESGRGIELSGFHDRVKALDQVIPVDYYIPGCPPTPELMKTAIMGVLEKRLPSKGSVLAEKQALCRTCPLAESRPERIRIKKFYRLFEKKWDPNRCFLDQELICLGPATRGGCNARCIRGNMPCRGCFGPTDGVRDQGGKSLSFLASLIDSASREEIKAITDSIPDPAGLFYRYTLPSSLLRRSRFEESL